MKYADATSLAYMTSAYPCSWHLLSLYKINTTTSYGQTIFLWGCTTRLNKVTNTCAHNSSKGTHSIPAGKASSAGAARKQRTHYHILHLAIARSRNVRASVSALMMEIMWVHAAFLEFAFASSFVRSTEFFNLLAFINKRKQGFIDTGLSFSTSNWTVNSSQTVQAPLGTIRYSFSQSLYLYTQINTS